MKPELELAARSGRTTDTVPAQRSMGPTPRSRTTSTGSLPDVERQMLGYLSSVTIKVGNNVLGCGRNRSLTDVVQESSLLIAQESSYRADRRLPSQVFSEGFSPASVRNSDQGLMASLRKGSNDLFAHSYNNQANNSNFCSFSTDLGKAEKYTTRSTRPKFVYEVDLPKNRSFSLEIASGIRGDSEVATYGPVSPESITSMIVISGEKNPFHPIFSARSYSAFEMQRLDAAVTLSKEEALSMLDNIGQNSQKELELFRNLTVKPPSASSSDIATEI